MAVEMARMMERRRTRMMLGTVVAFIGSGIVALALIWLLAMAVRATARPFAADDSSVAPGRKTAD